MSRPPATRNTRMSIHHDNVDWMIQIGRSGVITIRPKHAHERRAFSVKMADVIDMARGVRDLIPPAKVASAPPPPDQATVDFERRERMRAAMAALRGRSNAGQLVQQEIP